MPRRLPNGCHDGCRRSQHQRTGTKYHQDRHRPHNIAGEEISQHRKQERSRYEIASRLICHPFRRRLARLCLTDHPDHLRDRAIISHLLSHNVRRAQVIDRPAEYRIPHLLFHRHGFAGHKTLVNGGFTKNNFPIHRHMLPGNDAKPVADSHLGEWHHDLFAILQPPSHSRHQGK